MRTLYCKNAKNWKAERFVVIVLKCKLGLAYNNLSKRCIQTGKYRNDPKFSDRQVWANSADPDQTLPRGEV